MRGRKSAHTAITRQDPGLAAAYVRMSTEHQQYSTENQLDTIKLYAAAHSFEIIKIYTDAGKSGLRLEGRDALIQLFSDVESGVLGFSTILRRQPLGTLSRPGFGRQLRGPMPTSWGLCSLLRRTIFQRWLSRF